MYLDYFSFLIIFLAYVIPLYISNSAPIVLHGRIPVDLNLKFNKKRLLGDGKSILGTLVGIIAGFTAGLIFAVVFPINNLIPNYFCLAFLLAFGGVMGDIIESFFKRRIGLKRGEQWLIFDQIDFILGGLLLSLIVRIPEIELILILLIVTFFMHRISNYFAYKIKLKKVPW